MKLSNTTLFASIAGILLIHQANAVLPAIELDQTQIGSMAIPLTPTLVPSGASAVMPVSTNSSSQLQTKITVALVGIDDSLLPITPQTQLASGNVIEYHGYIINNSPERMRTMKVTMPIPANTKLVAKPSPEPVYGSNDGVQFNYMPIKLNIGGVIQEAPMSYYKFVRWDIEGLGLNEVAEVKYRVRVK